MQQSGSALLPVLLLMFLFSAIALGAAFVVRTELLVQDRFRQAAEGFYAAEAGLAYTLAELRGLADWTPVVDGSRTSGASLGSVSGEKQVAGGTVLVCCGAESSAERLARETLTSPSAARRTVRWRPFLWAPLPGLVPGAAPDGFFVTVWVADDEADGDGNPDTDLNDRVIVRAEAVQPDGLRRTVEAYAVRLLTSDPGGDGEGGAEGEEPPPGAAALGIVSWREVR